MESDRTVKNCTKNSTWNQAGSQIRNLYIYIYIYLYIYIYIDVKPTQGCKHTHGTDEEVEYRWNVDGLYCVYSFYLYSEIRSIRCNSLRHIGSSVPLLTKVLLIQVASLPLVIFFFFTVFFFHKGLCSKSSVFPLYRPECYKMVFLGWSPSGYNILYR